MAAGSAQVSVTTSATLLTQTDTDGGLGEAVLLKNTGAVTVYLGGAGVSTSNGYLFAAGETVGITLPNDEPLYGIVATGTCVVALLAVGV